MSKIRVINVYQNGKLDWEKLREMLVRFMKKC